MENESVTNGIKKGESPVGRLTFADGSVLEYYDKDKFIQAIKEELPYFSTTGVEIKLFTNDPQTRKDVDDQIFDLYGEKNPRSLEDYKVADPEYPAMNM